MKLRTALVSASLLLPSIASAHVAMTDPVPRSGDNGLTMGPCGGIPAGTPTPFTAGETITVSWAVGQPHGGSLTIDFAAADDSGFRQYILASDVSDAEGMPTSIDVQLPDIDCEACTLRLTQVNPNDDEYYSCADIALSGASAGSSSGGAGTTGADGSTGNADASTGDASTGDPNPGSTSDDSASASASASATGASATVGGGSAGSTGDGDSGSGASTDDDGGGCSCTSARDANGVGALAVLVLGLLGRRRRRSCHSTR